MTDDDVEIIEKTTEYRGYVRLDRYRLKHRLFEGGWSGTVTREVLERGHAVVVLPYDADLDSIVCIEQFRIGALTAKQSGLFGNGLSPWLVEVVAGIIEEGEDPEDVARREAMEESGCRVEELIPIGHYIATPGVCSESVFIYCGRVDASGAGGIHGISDEHEDIRVFVVPVAEAFAWLEAGTVTNAMTFIALQWLKIHHEDLRARWRARAAP